MAESDDWLSVGEIVGVQGLQGELRVNPASDFPERFTTAGPWRRETLGEITGGVHSQLPLEPLDPHNLADAQPVVALRHAIRRRLCR